MRIALYHSKTGAVSKRVFVLCGLIVVLPPTVHAQVVQTEQETEQPTDIDERPSQPTRLTLPIPVPIDESGQVEDAKTGDQPDGATPPADQDELFVKLGLAELLNVDIVTAGFFPTNIRNTPTYTISSSHTQWQHSTARNIKELLDIYVPGVQMTEHMWTGALIGARGVSVDNNAKTLVLLDGQVMNMRRHFGVTSELNLPLIGDLDQVETVHGPNAIVYGGGAINGVVNMVPKRAQQYPGLWLRSEAGPVDQLLLTEATYGVPYGKDNSLMLYAGMVSSGGFRPKHLHWNKENLAARANERATIRTREYVLPSAKFGLYWHHGGFSLQTQMMRIYDSTNSALAPDWFSKKNNPSDPSEPDPFDHGWYRAMLLIRPQYELKFSEETSITISLDGQWHDFALYDKSFQKRKDTKGRHGMARGGRERFLAAKAVFRTTWIPLNSLAIGGQVGVRDIDDNWLYFERNPTYGFEDSELSWLDVSLFVEDVFDINDHFKISAGARLDHTEYQPIVIEDMAETLQVEEKDWPEDIEKRINEAPKIDATHLSSRLAAIFTLSNSHLFKFSYSHGFRLPDAAYYGHMHKNNVAFRLKKLNISVPGAPNLGKKEVSLFVEKMDSFEFNSMNTFLEERLFLDLNLYYNIYRRLLSWNNDLFDNLPDSFGSIGGELIGRAEPVGGLILGISYGYSRPAHFSKESYEQHDSLVNGYRWSQTPKRAPLSFRGDEWICYSGHQIKAHLSWLLIPHRLRWHANLRLYSGVDTYDLERRVEANDTDEEQKSKWVPVQSSAFRPHVLVMNTAVTVNLNRHLAVKLNVQNITENSTPSASSLNAYPSSGHNGIDQRLYYLSLIGQI